MVFQSFPLILRAVWAPSHCCFQGPTLSRDLLHSQETLIPIFCSFTTPFLMRGTASCAPFPTQVFHCASCSVLLRSYAHDLPLLLAISA